MPLVALITVVATLAPLVQERAALDPTKRLEPDTVLVGHILDAEGNLLIEGWTVTASQRWGSVDGHSFVSARSAPDPSTGQFRSEGLPAATLRDDAVNGPARIENVWVKTKKGGETFVELRYAGPDPSQRLVVAIDTAPS